MAKKKERFHIYFRSASKESKEEDYRHLPMGSYVTLEEALKDASSWMRFFRPINKAGKEDFVLEIWDEAEDADSDEFDGADPPYTLRYQTPESEDFVILERGAIKK